LTGGEVGMSKAKYEYLMDKTDKDTFKAVMFACKMIREGALPANAIRKASWYYDCDMSEVARLVGQRGGRTNGEKKAKVIKKKTEDAQKEKARRLIEDCIRKHDGKPFFISHEEKRLSDETGFPQNLFRKAREQMRDEGLLNWETIKDSDGHIIGTWFLFS
jgi:hypothetical protein